jgi:uncharacterized membrane protein
MNPSGDNNSKKEASFLQIANIVFKVVLALFLVGFLVCIFGFILLLVLGVWAKYRVVHGVG